MLQLYSQALRANPLTTENRACEKRESLGSRLFFQHLGPSRPWLNAFRSNQFLTFAADAYLHVLQTNADIKL